MAAFSPEKGMHTKRACNNCKEIYIGETVTEALKNETEIPPYDFFVVPLRNSDE